MNHRRRGWGVGLRRARRLRRWRLRPRSFDDRMLWRHGGSPLGNLGLRSRRHGRRCRRRRSSDRGLDPVRWRRGSGRRRRRCGVWRGRHAAYRWPQAPWLRVGLAWPGQQGPFRPSVAEARRRCAARAPVPPACPEYRRRALGAVVVVGALGAVAIFGPGAVGFPVVAGLPRVRHVGDGRLGDWNVGLGSRPGFGIGPGLGVGLGLGIGRLGRRGCGPATPSGRAASTRARPVPPRASPAPPSARHAQPAASARRCRSVPRWRSAGSHAHGPAPTAAGSWRCVRCQRSSSSACCTWAERLTRL